MITDQPAGAAPQTPSIAVIGHRSYLLNIVLDDCQIRHPVGICLLLHRAAPGQAHISSPHLCLQAQHLIGDGRSRLWQRQRARRARGGAMQRTPRIWSVITRSCCSRCGVRTTALDGTLHCSSTLRQHGSSHMPSRQSRASSYPSNSTGLNSTCADRRAEEAAGGAESETERRAARTGDCWHTALVYCFSQLGSVLQSAFPQCTSHLHWISECLRAVGGMWRPQSCSQAGQLAQPAAQQGAPPPEVAATQQAADGREPQQAQAQQSPQQAQQQQSQPPLAGDNAMNVVLVGAECAPWSKTGGMRNITAPLGPCRSWLEETPAKECRCCCKPAAH